MVFLFLIKPKCSFSSSSCIKVIGFLFNYELNPENERFIMKDGSIPVKVFNKGIYNSDTFRQDYYDNSSKNKIVANYEMKNYDVNIKNYVKHI